MSDDQNRETEAEAVEAEEAVAGEEVGAEQAELEKLRAENADLKDRYLRLAAEMENLRRRTTRDVHDARSYSIAGFARDMLQVSDNLRRALDAVSEQAEGELKTFHEGVELTERTMLGALEKHGVKQINPKGEKFDPNFHQAMFEVPNPDVPNNTVFEVVQPGFVIGERVLRPAMVGVAKGGPKEPAAEPGPPNPQAEKDA
ncbi:MAG: nucleotide exchange factor GrpE [Rhizobiales bacterium]|nr:nucleotide exchange factor GrpE [Hyphomicrobiales bacterium]